MSRWCPGSGNRARSVPSVTTAACFSTVPAPSIPASITWGFSVPPAPPARWGTAPSRAPAPPASSTAGLAGVEARQAHPLLGGPERFPLRRAAAHRRPRRRPLRHGLLRRRHADGHLPRPQGRPEGVRQTRGQDALRRPPLPQPSLLLGEAVVPPLRDRLFQCHGLVGPRARLIASRRDRVPFPRRREDTR